MIRFSNAPFCRPHRNDGLGVSRTPSSCSPLSPPSNPPTAHPPHFTNLQTNLSHIDLLDSADSADGDKRLIGVEAWFFLGFRERGSMARRGPRGNWGR